MVDRKAEEPAEQWVALPDRGEVIRLHTLQWAGEGRPFVLLHGLAIPQPPSEKIS